MAKKTNKEAQRKVLPTAAARSVPARGPLVKYLPAALFALLLLVVALAYLQQQRGLKEALAVTDRVKIETSKGTVVVEVYPKMMPTTVTNFEKLVKSGFYDGLKWHRVEDWVIQTGDPKGTGEGGSPETIPLEVRRELKNVRGALGMARTNDPNSASSQFYVLRSDASWLNGNYAVFGKVVTGMDVVDKITAEDTMIKVTMEPGATK